MDEYSKLDSNTYTTDSWEAFVKVLDKAKAVLADGNVTQDTECNASGFSASA